MNLADLDPGDRVTVTDLRLGVVFAATVEEIDLAGRVIVVDDRGQTWRVGAAFVRRADG